MQTIGFSKGDDIQIGGWKSFDRLDLREIQYIGFETYLLDIDKNRSTVGAFLFQPFDEFDRVWYKCVINSEDGKLIFRNKTVNTMNSIYTGIMRYDFGDIHSSNTVISDEETQRQNSLDSILSHYAMELKIFNFSSIEEFIERNFAVCC